MENVNLSEHFQGKANPFREAQMGCHLTSFHGANAADSGSGTNYSVPAIYSTVRRNISMRAIVGRALGGFFRRIVSSELRT